MPCCADCGRIIFGKAVASLVFVAPICQQCRALEAIRPKADTETRALERMYALPSPTGKAT